MNTYWVKVNKASNGYILTSPKVIDEAGHTALEHELVTEEYGYGPVNARFVAMKKVLEHVLEFFNMRARQDGLRLRVVIENDEGEEVLND